MKIKDPQSALALVGVSIILLIVGFLILSRAAGFWIMAAAAVCALLASVSGTKVTRIAALVLFVVSAAFAVGFYPHFSDEQDRIKRTRLQK